VKTAAPKPKAKAGMSPASYDWQAISTGIRPTIHAADPLQRLPFIGNSDSRFKSLTLLLANR
jgi:hypothetical protein